MKKINIPKISSLITLIPIIAFIFGVIFFYINWVYSETGHGYLFLIYTAISVSSFVAIRASKIKMGLFVLLFLIPTFIYSNAKFEWNKSHIQAAQNGNFFEMLPYMDKYPSFEEHHFAWLFKQPKWVDFNNDCYAPMLKEGKIGRNCKSATLIKDNYGIDINNIISDHYKKMQDTAKRLERGRFKSKISLKTCIQKKNCTMIPLLPADTGEIDRQSKKYLEIRKQFWRLVNRQPMSEYACNFFEICRVMLKNNVISIKPEK